MPEASVLQVPRYRLFGATWGSFAPESELRSLEQTKGSALALSTAMETLDALREEPVLIHDVPGPACINELDRFLDAPGRDVILYFASHGLVPSGANQFFRLATGDTRDVDDLNRAFVIAEVIEKLIRTGPGHKLVILDACYSGKAAASLLSRGAVDLDLPGETCVLFSTDPFTQASAVSNGALTAFTGSLAEILVRGVPGRGPRLSVRSVYSALQATAQVADLPMPWLVSTGSAAERITFQNAAAATSGDDADADFGQRVAAFDHRTEILYVEDSARQRNQFKAELEKAGHRVTLAAGPGEGHDALASGHFDIVVIDLLLVDDVPATEFIQLCTRMATDSQLFLVSREFKGSKDNWGRLGKIFAYPSRISAFLWKPKHVQTVVQHANRIRKARLHTLAHIDGLEEVAALVTERIISRVPAQGEHSERLQLQVRICVERLVETWFPADPDDYVYIESLIARPVDGGRSTSVVFTLIPTLRGIDPESVTPFVLKLGPRIDIDEEVYRYDRYVQVGVPLDFRTDKVASALVGDVGGIIYSFRGADDNAIRDVSQLTPVEIEMCLETLFGKNSPKRWYASRGTGDGVSPMEHFARLGFPSERFTTSLERLQTSVATTLADVPTDSPARRESLRPAYEDMATAHHATLVHGDLKLDNLVQINESRYAIIDYRTVGLGPRLIDFVTLEIACWLLSQAPEASRADRFIDALEAVPRTLQDDPARHVPDWLEESYQLARKCRELAKENHKDASDEEYGALLWLAAVRSSEFRPRTLTTAERNTQRAVLPAIALAAQAMFDGQDHVDTD